jgi:hypothetical protein
MIKDILEMFNVGVPYEIQTKRFADVNGQWVAVFNTNHDKFTYETQKQQSDYFNILKDYIEKYYNKIIPMTDVWSMGFLSDETGYAPTGDNEPSKIFKTVFDITKEWFLEVNPKIIMFASKSDEPSRIKLYDALAKKIESDFNMFEYIGSSKNIPELMGLDTDNQYFWLVKKELL